eukprot:COSAG04_NODE_16926_length_485_cov_0.668394_1_plen_82_part_01
MRATHAAKRRRCLSILYQLKKRDLNWYNIKIFGGQVGARLFPHLPPILAHPHDPNLGSSLYGKVGALRYGELKHAWILKVGQ